MITVAVDPDGGGSRWVRLCDCVQTTLFLTFKLQFKSLWQPVTFPRLHLGWCNIYRSTQENKKFHV